MKRNIKIGGQLLLWIAQGSLLKFARSANRRREILNECDRLWYTIDRHRLFHLLHRCKLRGLVRYIKNADGITAVSLTDKGRMCALRQQFRSIVLPIPRRWDKKWRVVVFDVPEEKKRSRDALRGKLKELGFREFQKSVFVFPYHCENEINFVVNYFNMHKHVRYGELRLSYDHDLRKHFSV